MQHCCLQLVVKPLMWLCNMLHEVERLSTSCNMLHEVERLSTSCNMLPNHSKVLATNLPSGC